MILRALLAAVAALSLATGAAQAASGSIIGLRPAAEDQSWINVRAAPGRVVPAKALLVNHTDERQTVTVGTADAVTTAEGVFTLAGEGTPREGVGAWIAIRRGALTLAPGEQRPLRFTVRVPADAEPGDFAGGVVVSSGSRARMRSGQGLSVRVVERIGLRVYVAVAGRRDAGVAIDGLRARAVGGDRLQELAGLQGGVDVDFTVRNAGNVRHDRLGGEVEILDGDEVAASRPVDLGTMLPGAERAVSVSLDLPRWSAGSYRVVVRMDGSPAARAEASVGVSPMRAYATGGLLLGLMGAVYWGRARRGT